MQQQQKVSSQRQRQLRIETAAERARREKSSIGVAKRSALQKIFHRTGTQNANGDFSHCRCSAAAADWQEDSFLPYSLEPKSGTGKFLFGWKSLSWNAELHVPTPPLRVLGVVRQAICLKSPFVDRCRCRRRFFKNIHHPALARLTDSFWLHIIMRRAALKEDETFSAQNGNRPGSRNDVPLSLFFCS